MIRPVATALLISSLLSGCGGTPRTDYYLLEALATPAANTQSVQGSLGIGPVEVAGYLQHREITRRVGNLQHQHTSQRWGEPLDAGVTRVLARNLSALTGNDQVVVFPWVRRHRPEQTVSVQVLELNPTDGQLQLVASWSVSSAEQSITRLGQWQTPLANDQPGALAQAASVLLLELSEAIAPALAQGSPQTSNQASK